MKKIIGLLLLVIGVSIVTVLAMYSPYVYGFYPKCPTFLLFKVQCFLCGVTRSMYELLNGNIIAASKQNILFVISLPLLLYEGIRTYSATFFDYSLKAIPYPSWFWKVLIGILFIFMIWRNI